MGTPALPNLGKALLLRRMQADRFLALYLRLLPPGVLFRAPKLRRQGMEWAQAAAGGGNQVEQCPQCNMRFSSVTALVDHVEKVHERNGTQTGVMKVTIDVCPKCSKGFRDPVALVKHVERDHGGTSKA
ncbi:zinc finger (C2H2 type, AN1-like) family protein [Actinidia rufa]|uniref:Zinc finger (C2H2 type, AN1-like) family protein n=1 Tax=Actinidia rufa TaxID=165716 RepID=A0A7J0F503_9ERIC|nr:zinc finger (C2H2 type, AN1-like) family protein [Actinidia rufa]